MTSEATLTVRRADVRSGPPLRRDGREARTSSDSSTGGAPPIGSIVTTAILGGGEGALAHDVRPAGADDDAGQRAGVPRPVDLLAADRDAGRALRRRDEDLHARRLGVQRERGAVGREEAGAA